MPLTINIPTVSKTTLNGIIAFFIASVPLAQQHPELHISPVVMAWLSFVAGLARLWVGLKQTDADAVPAFPPGSDKAQLVPAHPVPDNPADTLVSKKTA